MAATTIPLTLSAQKGLPLVHEPLTEPEWQARLAADPALPPDFAACMALVQAIFRGRAAIAASPGILPRALHALVIDPGRSSGTPLLESLIEGLRNPHLTAEEIAQLDGAIANFVPPLPTSYDTTHFHLTYTTNDSNPDNNMTAANVQAVGATLEDAWAKYVDEFSRAPYLGPSSQNNRIPIQFYYLADSYGHTSKDSGIDLNSKRMQSLANARNATPRHELFHRVQYAFGWRVRFNATSDGWWVEGMSTWAALSQSNLVSSPGRVSNMFASPSTSVFGRSYDSLPLWVYLETQQIKGNPNYFGPVSFLNSYTVDGNAKKAFAKAVMDAFSGASQDNLDWYIHSFYINSVNKSWRSVGDGAVHNGVDFYPTIKDYSDAPVSAPFPSVTATRRINPGDTVSFDESLPQAAAIFYKFTFTSDAPGHNVTVRMTGKDGSRFFMSVLKLRNDGSFVPPVRIADMTAAVEDEYTFSVGFSTYDYILVVLSYEHSSPGTGNFNLQFSMSWGSQEHTEAVGLDQQAT